MARGLVRAASSYLQTGGFLLAEPPLSMSCWFKVADVTNNHQLMWVGDKDVQNRTVMLIANGGVAGDPVRMFKGTFGGGSSVTANTSNSFTANTWHHICGTLIRESGTTHTAESFLDGDLGDRGFGQATSGAMTGVDSQAIGIQFNNLGAGLFFDGHVAEAGWWNRKLDDREVVALSKGFAPSWFAPDGYMDMKRGDDMDLISRLDYAPFGTVTVEDHPPGMIYPDDDVQYSFQGGAAPSFVPYPRPRGLRGGLSVLVGGMQ